MVTKNAVLFYTLGYPGSGKTAFASQYARDIGAQHLYADKIGVQIYQQPTFSEKERQHILDEMDWLALNLLKDGISVIYDANINSHAERMRLSKLAKSAMALAIGIWIKTPPDVAKERLRVVRTIDGVRMVFLTDKRRGNLRFGNIVKSFEIPKADELVIPVSGTISYPKQLAAVTKTLQQKLSFFSIILLGVGAYILLIKF